MTSALSRRVWWERRWWWLPAVALLLVDLLALGWYQVAYSGFTRSVDQQLAARSAERERLEQRVAERRADVERLRHNERELVAFYDERLGSPSERLTEVIAEVRSLARSAGLEPTAINYPRQEIDELGLIERSFSFAVRGSYADLRRFINLLELTRTFLTLEEVQLTGRGDGRELAISLQLSVLFAAERSETAGPSETGGEAAS